MNLNKILVFACTSLIFVSCRKVKSTEQESEVQSIKQMITQITSIDSVDTLDNYVFLDFHRTIGRPKLSDSTLDKSVSIGGMFTDLSGNPCSVGNLYINNNVISLSANNIYSYNSYLDNASGRSRVMGVDLSNLYNQDLNVTIDGNSVYNGFSTYVHVPAELNLKASLPYVNSYIRGSDLTFTWTGDPQNSFGNVIIQVYYFVAQSKRENPSNPDSIAMLSYLVPDNGIYTIPASALDVFPLTSYFGFRVARTNEYKVTSTLSGKDVFIYPVAEVSSLPILVSTKPSAYVRLERTQDYYYSDPYYTIESTDYRVRFYSNDNFTVPFTLIDNINIGYTHSQYQWTTDGYSNYYTGTSTLTGQAGTTENFQDISYTELYYFDGYYGYTNDYWLNSGPGYITD